MAERTIRVKVLVAHCAGSLGNFDVGDVYECPETIARGRIYNNLVQEAPPPPAGKRKPTEPKVSEGADVQPSNTEGTAPEHGEKSAAS